MTGLSSCCLTDGKGWECRAAFPRRHIRHGDASSKLYGRCLKHRVAQYSSPAALARQKDTDAARGKMRRGTAEESERQAKKKAKHLGRILPTGNLRTLLRRLRSKFKGILAKSAQGKLFVTTMKTIDCFLEMPVIQRPKDCRVAVVDGELMSPDGETGLPVSAGLFQIGTACTPAQAKTSHAHAAISGTGQVGS